MIRIFKLHCIPLRLAYNIWPPIVPSISEASSRSFRNSYYYIWLIKCSAKQSAITFLCCLNALAGSLTAPKLEWFVGTSLILSVSFDSSMSELEIIGLFIAFFWWNVMFWRSGYTASFYRLKIRKVSSVLLGFFVWFKSVLSLKRSLFVLSV